VHYGDPMIGLAALVLGTSLLAASGPEDVDSDYQTMADTSKEVSPETISPKLQLKHRQMVKNAIMGVGLEMGSVLFHALDGTFIGQDLGLTSAGCDAPDNPCGGPPFIILIPLGATTMGWIGAARLAEAREADLRDSWVYWVGSALEIGSYLALAKGSDHRDRNGRLAWHTAFVSMASLGTVLQVIGALTGPTRSELVASRSPRVAPGCAPLSGGVACGVLVSGF
jgi:hypothetical protein